MQNAKWKSCFTILHSALCNVHSRLRLHRCEELGVGLGLVEAFEDDLHLLDRRERVEHATHDPNSGEVLLANEQLFLACAGPLQVDRRE